MTILRPMLTVFVIAALPGPWALSQGQHAPNSPQRGESFPSVKLEYDEALEAWLIANRAARDVAKANGQERDFTFDQPSPDEVFSPRFLAIAESNPEGPVAIDSLKMTLRTGTDYRDGTPRETRAKAVKILADYYVTKPAIKGVLRYLTLYDDAKSRALVADVIARNPDRTVQLAAYKGLVIYCEIMMRFAETAKNPERLASIEKRSGKEYVRERLAMAEAARPELDRLTKILHEQYADLIDDLSIGKAAPEIRMQALDGTEGRLSALKGKVVVLDIWATWCEPCKAMIPHEREMVERLRDRPFVLVSISADEKKETLTAFLANEKMPWTHWWNGREGGMLADWDIKYFPTIFVIDAQGVIRHKDLRGDELEKAVNAMLAEKPQG
jgi:thiol-disulfide isomerase/thioredoxin